MPSRSPDRALMRHLALVLAVKFAALALIWLLLVLPHALDVDAGAMGERVAPPPQGAADDRFHAR